MIDEEMKEVKFSEKGNKKSEGSKEVSFVVTCHPSLNCLSRINKDNLIILFIIHETKAVFSPGSIILFRSAHKISSYLVRTKLYTLERFVSSIQSKKRRCEVCTNVTDTDTFSGTVTGETF